MTATELKSSIHKKVDEINDTEMLEEVQSIINYITMQQEDWNDLPENVKQAIEDGLSQFENSKVLSYEEVKQRHSRWFSR
jgi:hypothetical protein